MMMALHSRFIYFIFAFNYSPNSQILSFNRIKIFFQLLFIQKFISNWKILRLHTILLHKQTSNLNCKNCDKNNIHKILI